MTLGFFILVVNALMLYWVPGMVIGFHVDGFGSAFWGAILIGIISWMLSAFFRGSDGRVHVLTHHTQIKRVEGRVIEPWKTDANDLLPRNALPHRRGLFVRLPHQRGHG